MNKTEISTLLALIAQVDNRAISPGDVVAWHGILGDLRFDECETALNGHRRESTDWVMPAHIRRRVLAMRQDAAMRALPVSPDALVPMPDWFASVVEQNKLRVREENRLRKERGEAPCYGETVMHAIDRGPR